MSLRARQADARISERSALGERLSFLSHARDMQTRARAIRVDLQLFNSAYDTVVLADSPLDYYRLDETSGTSAADLGSLAAAGTYLGASGTDYALNWTPGPITAETQGGYQNKNTNASHGVSIPANTAATNTTSWFVHGWFYANALGATQTLFGASGSRRVLVTATGTISVQLPQVSFTTASAISAGAWHHVALVSDLTAGTFGTAKVYIDGVLDANSGAYTSGTSSRDWLPLWYLGQYDTLTSYKFNGQIARVAFGTGVLSGSRIATIYSAASASSTSPPAVVSYSGTPNQASTTFHSTSGTIALPHAPTAGNLILIEIAYVLGTGAALTAPTGFAIEENTQTRIALVSKKNCLATDQTITLSFGGSTGTYCSASIREISGYNTTTPIAVHSSNNTTSGGSPFTQTTPGNTVPNNSLPFAVFENGNANYTSGSQTAGWTLDFTQPSTNVALATLRGPVGAGVVTNVSINAANTASYQSILYAVAPAVATLSATPTSVVIAKPGATATTTISGGTAPYAITTAPAAGVATATISSGVVTVTGVAAGTTSLVVTDNAGVTGTLAITVDAPVTVAPSAILVGYNAGAQFITATKSGYSGALSAVSSNTAVATVTGGGSGPTQTFQVVRVVGSGGTCNVTISAADGDSIVVPVTYEGPLTVNSISQPTAQTVVVNVSESSYAGAFTATVLSGPATPNVPSAAPGTAGGVVAFTFTWPVGATGSESTIRFGDDHGGTLGVTLNIQGPLVVSASALVFSQPGGGFATTLTASEAADVGSLTAASANTAIATVAVNTSGPGAASWTITPVAVGMTQITVSDGAQTQTVAVTVNNTMSFSPAAVVFADPSSAAIPFTISGGAAPFALSVVPGTLANAALSTAQNANTGTVAPGLPGSGTLVVTDSQGQVMSVPVSVGAALSLNPSKLTFIGLGGTASIQMVGGRGPFTVTSSNTAVATISGAGPYLVTAAGLGSSTVTVTDADGEVATASVIVQPPIPDPSPTAASDVRVTVFDAKFASVLVLNASGDIMAVKYEDQPGGCAAGTLATNLTWEQLYAKGTYTGRNGVEISTLDDYLRLPTTTNTYNGDMTSWAGGAQGVNYAQAIAYGPQGGVSRYYTGTGSNVGSDVVFNSPLLPVTVGGGVASVYADPTNVTNGYASMMLADVNGTAMTANGAGYPWWIMQSNDATFTAQNASAKQFWAQDGLTVLYPAGTTPPSGWNTVGFKKYNSLAAFLAETSTTLPAGTVWVGYDTEGWSLTPVSDWSTTVGNERGTYSGTAFYNVNDIVHSTGGEAFIALVGNSGVTPAQGSTWQAIVPDIPTIDASCAAFRAHATALGLKVVMMPANNIAKGLVDYNPYGATYGNQYAAWTQYKGNGGALTIPETIAQYCDWYHIQNQGFIYAGTIGNTGTVSSYLGLLYIERGLVLGKNATARITCGLTTQDPSTSNAVPTANTLAAINAALPYVSGFWYNTVTNNSTTQATATATLAAMQQTMGTFGKIAGPAGRFATPYWNPPINLLNLSDSLATTASTGTPWTNSGGFGYGNAGPGGATSVQFTGTGTGKIFYQDPVAVIPGQPYAFSVNANLAAVTSGNCQLFIRTSGTTTNVASVTVTAGTNGRVSVVIPSVGAGVTSLRFGWGTNTSVGTSIWSQPMLENASVASGYYMSSQNPQYQMRVVASASQPGGFAVTNGQLFSITQPMFEVATTSAGYYAAYGQTRLYVGDTRPYDQNIHPENAQIAIDDGINFCARIPITSVGTDQNGPYIVPGAPLAGGGNPASIPRYGSGALIFRRRYAGRIVKRDKTQSQYQKATLSLTGMSLRVDERNVSEAFNSVDVGTAIYQTLIGGDPTKPPLFPDLIISQANIPLVGTNFTGKQDKVSCASMIQQILSVIAADTWVLRVSHDRTPRLLKLYNGATNVYTYNVAMPQKAPYYTPAGITSSDQDVSQMFNAVEVTGDTNATTNQPAAGVVGDTNSIATYLQIDGSPISVTGISTDDQAASFGQAQLNQHSIPAASHKFTVQCRNDYNAAALYSPIGLQSADALDAVDAVTVSGFNSSARGPNLVDDSNLAVASQTWRTANFATGTGWSVGSAAGAFGTNSWRISETTGANQSLSAWAYSQAMYAPPGAQISLAASFNALLSGAPGGTTGVGVWIYDPTLSTLYGYITGTFGSSTRPVTTFQLPAGVTSFVLALSYTGTLVANSVIDVSAFDVRIGLNPSAAYTDNLAAPNIYGLPTSIVTTITPGGDRYQEVSFAAIEPDWNAQLSELANGIATSLRNNTAPGAQIDAYCLSTDGQNYSYNAQSLALYIPSVKALFAPNSIIQTVPAQTITLAPNATTWVWLTPSLSWLQQTTYSSQPGSILLAYFTTSAVGIIGDFPKASIGVVKVGTGNLPPPNGIVAPAIGASQTALGVSSSQVMGDAQAAVEVTNVPQDQTVANLAFYYREANATPAAQWTLDGEENLAGVPYPTPDQTVIHQYAHLAYGKSYDFAVAYEGVAGYGALTQYASAFAMPTTGPGGVGGGPSGSPNITASSWTASTVGPSVIQRGTLSFTEADFTTPPPVNLRFIHLVMRNNGDAATAPRLSDVPIDPRSSTTGTYTRSAILPAGGGVDYGVYYEFTNGQQSPTAWPSGLSNIGDPNGGLFDPGDGFGGINHARNSVAARTFLDSSGNAKSSAQVRTNIPNSTAFGSPFHLHFASNSSGTSLTIWYDNGSGADVIVRDADNVNTTNLGHTTSSAPTINDAAGTYTSGTNIYVLAYSSGGTVTIERQTTPFTQAQIQTAYQDGGNYAQYATYSTNATITLAPSFSGGVGGNGGRVPLN